MPTRLRRTLRHARRGAWYAAAVVLVLMALAAGVASQLLPLAERHPDRIAAWLSGRAGRTVAFDRVETQWTRRGPLLRLEGLRVGDGRQAVAIGAAEILVSQYAGLLPGRSFTELRLRNVALTLQRSDDGRWSVRGLPGQQQPGADPLGALEGLGELQVVGGKLSIDAPSLQIATTLPKVDVRLKVDGDRVRAALRAWIRQDVTPVDGVLDFDRKRGDGSMYAAAKRADLSAWSPLLRLAGVAAEAGSGRAEAWTQLRGHRVTVVTVDAALKQLRLRGAPLREGNGALTTPRAEFGRLEVRARWRDGRDGWRFDAPRLRSADADGKRMQTLDGLVVAGGKRYALLAERIDADPLFAIAALSDRLQPGLRQWLHAAKPGAVLRGVQASGVRGGALRARAGIVGLHFAPVGNAPGLSGLAGNIQGDADGFAFAFDAASTLRIDWPRGFGLPHDVRLRGEAVGWREGAGWQLATPALRVDGQGYGADVRGGLWFQGDGTRPVIGLAATLDEAAVPVAKKFWIRHSMPPAAIRWLDAALVGGRVRNGRAVVSGDLDDWPFRNRDGLFQADAQLVDAVVRFQPEWPAAEAMSGDVSFVADGFTFAGKAMLAGVAIPEFSAGIPRFGQAQLSVDARAAGDAAKLLALLRRSPLQKEHGATMARLGASGPVAATFALDLPMDRPEPSAKIDGSVELRGVRLSESEWKLAFNDVRGTARYDEKGFDGNDLRAARNGQPGKLSLRAGEGHVRDGGQSFEAELEATLAGDELLDRAPDLAWLKPYVDGRSPWTIAVAIPKASAANAAAVSRLQLRSDLIGTTLSLPAPMAKPASSALSTQVEAALPLGKGDISVAFGDRLALRTRNANGQTGVRVVLGAGRVDEAPPASGLIASGRTPALDAIEWIALLRDGGGNGLPLRRIDVTTGRLQMLGGAFPDIRVRVAPADAGTGVQLEGASLAGALLLPQAEGAAIAGRLQRLHWRSAAAAPAVQKNTAAPAMPDRRGNDIDPARIPPLNLVVDDLRLGDAVLGTATARTRPTAAGLQIMQLQTRAPKQRIDITGDWNGRGAAARTRLVATVGSDDFGALLAGLGYGGRLAGGKGEAKFDANWPGSPALFQLGALEGSLSILAKDGRLVEVEPGAGRVLGLLSIAEIPRRLTLDFRDFFSKGFAFSRIGGNVRFANGQARSDDLVIDGPAAEINISGAANLRAQTFDQRIQVLPKTGNLLTAVGAIAGGPVGAAVGAVANAVLGKPLGQMGAKTYRVTGPWKDPKVEVIGREPPPQAAVETGSGQNAAQQ